MAQNKTLDQLLTALFIAGCVEHEDGCGGKSYEELLEGSMCGQDLKKAILDAYIAKEGMLHAVAEVEAYAKDLERAAREASIPIEQVDAAYGGVMHAIGKIKEKL